MSEKTIYSVALVYSKTVSHDQTTWKLIHRITDAASEEEAIGKAVVFNRKETDGFGLQLCSALALAGKGEGK